MTDDPLALAVDLLETSLDDIEDVEARHDIREAQQLLVGYLEVGELDAPPASD